MIGAGVVLPVARGYPLRLLLGLGAPDRRRRRHLLDEGKQALDLDHGDEGSRVAAPHIVAVSPLLFVLVVPRHRGDRDARGKGVADQLSAMRGAVVVHIGERCLQGVAPEVERYVEDIFSHYISLSTHIFEILSLFVIFCNTKYKTLTNIGAPARVTRQVCIKNRSRRPCMPPAARQNRPRAPPRLPPSGRAQKKRTPPRPLPSAPQRTSVFTNSSAAALASSRNAADGGLSPMPWST